MKNNLIKNTDFSKLVGKWKTDGRILETEKSPELAITGTDTYEIILGGFFLLHAADVVMGEEKSQTHEIIGMGEFNDEIILQHYNNKGSSGHMTATLKNGELKIKGEGLQFKGSFCNNETEISGVWQKISDHKKWIDYLTIRFTKIE